MDRRFADRADAGEQLAQALAGTVAPDELILGIPRGGIVVAHAVASKLSLPLDVAVAHKLGAPGNPELAIGAVGPDGTVVLDERVMASLPAVPAEYIEREAASQMGEIGRRSAFYRGDRPPLRVAGRSCVVVDDGIATGSTARAALLWLERQGARRRILAIPVAPADAVARLRSIADDVVCLVAPRIFLAVGQWYERFEQVGDDEVVAALAAGSP